MLSSNFEKTVYTRHNARAREHVPSRKFFFFVGVTVKVTGCYEHLSFAATRVQ